MNSLNYDLLPLEKLERFRLPIDISQVDYSQFQYNNFIQPDSKNKLLKKIEARGGALWLGHNGKIYFRVTVDEDIIEFESDKIAERAITSYLSARDILLFKGRGKGEHFQKPDIEIKELISAAERFTPFSNSEFYLVGDNWYRTNYIPSIYQSKRYEINEYYNESRAIIKLIKNLTNKKEEYLNWVMNWLACFFQTLKKSQVALVLRGDQGSGKGVLFKHIISELIGRRYCITVDSDNLESSFKNWIEGRLFINLNEVAADMKARRNVKNFIKQLVTDDVVNVEKKHEDAKEVKVYANVLITSNEILPLAVEHNDRRYTVFKTGPALKSIVPNIDRFIQAIDAELPAFAKYLSEYKADFKLYNTALNTPEKQAIVTGTTGATEKFINAIKNHDISFFEAAADDSDDVKVIDIMQQAFKVEGITQHALITVYQVVFDTQKNRKKIMSELRILCPELFSIDKMKNNNGRYYKIPKPLNKEQIDD